MSNKRDDLRHIWDAAMEGHEDVLHAASKSDLHDAFALGSFIEPTPQVALARLRLSRIASGRPESTEEESALAEYLRLEKLRQTAQSILRAAAAGLFNADEFAPKDDAAARETLLQAARDYAFASRVCTGIEETMSKMLAAQRQALFAQVLRPEDLPEVKIIQ